MSEKFFVTKEPSLCYIAAINRHWEFINEQITKTFNGEKTIAIDIEK